MDPKLLIVAFSCILLQVSCGPITGLDLDFDVAEARRECVNLELQSALFKNRVSLFLAAVQNDISNNGDAIVQKLRDAGLAPIEADRIELLIGNSVAISVSSANTLTNNLRNTDTVLNKIITSLDGDLGTLGQADRDLRTSVLSVNTTYVDSEMNIKTNFDVTEFSVNEAANSLDFETAVEVSILWQKIDDILAQQNSGLSQEKILFDGHGNLAVNALDIVVDQLP